MFVDTASAGNHFMANYNEADNNSNVLSIPGKVAECVKALSALRDKLIGARHDQEFNNLFATNLQTTKSKDGASSA